MKKAIRIFSTVVMATVLMSSTVLATEKPTPNTPTAVEVRYVGLFENKPVFELNLERNSTEKITIVVKNEFDDILFAETITSGSYRKKLCIDGTGYENIQLKVSVTNGKNTSSKTYQFKDNSRVVNDYV